jgi:NAD(P)-dependent dehydrogenase (short-subunit alcohol dehydrogenase family)
MSLFDLTGKVAIVTGSSRGIGRSIAINMAAHGARVVVSSRKADACEAVVKEIRAAGGEAMSIPANISDKQAMQALVDGTRKAYGTIDVLVCNAASNPYFGPAAGMGDEVFEKIMRNNVLSNHWLCTMVRPDMAAKKDGAIIIVSSIGGLKGSTEIGAYCISKAADMQLARNLAFESGPDNIRVNVINPVAGETAMLAQFMGRDTPEMRAKFGKTAIACETTHVYRADSLATAEPDYDDGALEAGDE